MAFRVRQRASLIAANGSESPATHDPTLFRLDDEIAWYDRKSGRCQYLFKWLKFIEISAAASIPIMAAFHVPVAGGAVLGGLIVVLERWELLVVAALSVGVALASLVLPRLLASRQVAAGLLLGSGIATLFLWPRYIAIPILEVSRIASPGLGGFIGLFGAGLIAYAGIAARRAVGTSTAVAPAATAAIV